MPYSQEFCTKNFTHCRSAASFLLNNMAKSFDFYFKRTEGQSSSLPASISQATIDAVEREVRAIHCSRLGSCKTQGEYIELTEKEKVIIGKYATKHGIEAAMRYFKQNKHFPDLKEATVRGWKNLYLRKLHVQSQGRKRDALPVQIEVLPSKHRGRRRKVGR